MMNNALLILLIPIFFMLLDGNKTSKRLSRKKFIEFIDRDTSGTLVIEKKFFNTLYSYHVSGFYFEMSCYGLIKPPVGLKVIDLTQNE